MESTAFLSKSEFSNAVAILCGEHNLNKQELGCTNLTEIRVPWSEDDPINQNAPWGATNANIQYNYHGE